MMGTGTTNSELPTLTGCMQVPQSDDQELLKSFLRILSTTFNSDQLADRLIARFGSLSRITNADETELQQVVGDCKHAVIGLRLVSKLARKLTEPTAFVKPHLEGYEDVISFVRVRMGYLRNEEIAVIFLDVKYGILSFETMQRGSPSFVAIRPRQIVGRSLELGANKLIIIHNHPSGHTEPSASDVSMTQMICEAADIFDIEIVDHIIISEHSDYSFRSSGLLDKITRFEPLDRYLTGEAHSKRFSE